MPPLHYFYILTKVTLLPPRSFITYSLVVTEISTQDVEVLDSECEYQVP